MSPRPHFSSILILCEGNHCRSPIAEGLFKAALGPGVKVESAGLRALEGHAVHPEAQSLMAGLGLDLSAFRGRQLTPAMALGAELILVMDEAQKDGCELLVPSTRGRVFLLGHWLVPPRAIQDPYTLGPGAFRQALADIEQSIASWLPRIVS